MDRNRSPDSTKPDAAPAWEGGNRSNTSGIARISNAATRDAATGDCFPDFGYGPLVWRGPRYRLGRRSNEDSAFAHRTATDSWRRLTTARANLPDDTATVWISGVLPMRGSRTTTLAERSQVRLRVARIGKVPPTTIVRISLPRPSRSRRNERMWLKVDHGSIRLTELTRRLSGQQETGKPFPMAARRPARITSVTRPTAACTRDFRDREALRH